MKRARRHQNGNVFRKGGGWYLRYYDEQLQPDGTTIRIRKCRKLVGVGGEYRSKAAARVLADEFLAPINNGTVNPHRTMKLSQYVDTEYLPYVQTHKRPSTYHAYANL